MKSTSYKILSCLMKQDPEPSLSRCDVTVRTGTLTPKNLKYLLSPLSGHIITFTNV